jgi:predicted outer membrane protein
MVAFIRSLCLAALLAAGSAWAQQQPVDSPENPDSAKAKDKQGSTTPSSVANQQVDEAQKASPHHPQNKDTKPTGTASSESIEAAQRESPHSVQNKDREQLGRNPKMDQQGRMAGADHDAMMKNATPEMMLQKLHLTNLHEIESAKLADQNGSDKIKTYASTLQRDHQDADMKVKELASKKGISLSDTPMRPEKQKEKQAAKDRLASLKGAEFDRAFANQMSMDHRKVISLARAWRQNCSDQEVCSLIDSLLPQLQQHQQMADQLKGPMPQGRAPGTR